MASVEVTLWPGMQELLVRLLEPLFYGHFTFHILSVCFLSIISLY